MANNLGQAVDPDVSPFRANLEGLPPATIIGAQIDPLQSEGASFAKKLAAAGVRVDYKLYAGVTHEFFGMGTVLEQAKSAEDLAGADLRQAFGN